MIEYRSHGSRQVGRDFPRVAFPENRVREDEYLEEGGEFQQLGLGCVARAGLSHLVEEPEEFQDPPLRELLDVAPALGTIEEAGQEIIARTLETACRIGLEEQLHPLEALVGPYVELVHFLRAEYHP